MTSKHEDDDQEDEIGGLIGALKNLILTPFRIAFSNTAQRAYLTTFLIVSTTSLLLGLAVTAYTLFYLSYVPRIGFERPIHLQFDNVFAQLPAREAHPYPYGLVGLTPDIISGQQYDVKIELSLPRTRQNRDAGNFMLEVNMLAPGEQGTSILDTIGQSLLLGSESNVLARSRRPAILPYRSLPVEAVYKLSELHWYLLGFRSESDKLTVSMFESVEFARGWRSTPAYLKLELQSVRPMQVYDAKAIFIARLSGLRWLMYNHRVVSAAIFISTFWVTELLFAALAWAAITFVLATPDHVAKAEELHEAAEHMKQEQDEDSKPALSDTERTFPTLSGQQPLRYSSPQVKREEVEEAVILPETPGRNAEADDEDEDADFFVDSGIGTSMESGAGRRDSIRKRRGRMSSRPE